MDEVRRLRSAVASRTRGYHRAGSGMREHLPPHTHPASLSAPSSIYGSAQKYTVRRILENRVPYMSRKRTAVVRERAVTVIAAANNGTDRTLSSVPVRLRPAGFTTVGDYGRCSSRLRTLRCAPSRHLPRRPDKKIGPRIFCCTLCSREA